MQNLKTSADIVDADVSFECFKLFSLRDKKKIINY